MPTIELLAERDSLKKELEKVKSRIKSAEEREEVYRKALEWYANLVDPIGTKARETLAQTRGKELKGGADRV